MDGSRPSFSCHTYPEKAITCKNIMEFLLKKNQIDKEFAIYSDKDFFSKTSYCKNNKYLQTEVERIHHAFKAVTQLVPKGGSGLEVGASPFYLSYLLSKYHNMKIDAIFYSKDMHQLAKNDYAYYKGGSINLIYQDINKIGELKNAKKYDLIISMECIEHLDQFPFDFFEFAKSNLINNGILYITVPNVCAIVNILKLIANRNIYMPYRPDCSGRHKYEYTINGIKNIIHDCMEFDIVKLSTFSKKNNWKVKLIYNIFSCFGLYGKYLPTIESISLKKQENNSKCNWNLLSQEIFVADKSTES